MVTLSERSIALARILLSGDIFTIDELVEKIGVTKKTIIGDLDLLSDYLSENNLVLRRKPRVGIWVEGNHKQKTYLSNVLSIRKSNHPTSTQERQEEILLRLLDSSDYLTIQDIADDLFVSKSTIVNDLSKVRVKLEEKMLVLERRTNRGVLLVGKEEHKRQLLAELLMERNEFSFLLKGDPDTSEIFDVFINSFLFNLDRKLILQIIYSLNMVEKESGILFTDLSFTNLIVHIAILINRLLEGYILEIDDKEIQKTRQLKEFEYGKKIAKQLEEVIHVSISLEEICYLVIHLASAKIFKYHKKQTSSSPQDLKLNQLTEKMILRASDVLQTDLSHDSGLLDFLSIHIGIAINRLENTKQIKNPYLETIKKQYPLVFEAALQSFKVLQEELELPIDADEISFIAMHYQASLDRLKMENQSKYKVVIICNSGMGTSQLVAAKLKKEFSEIEILEISPAIGIKENPVIKKSDFLISTVPITLNEQEVVLVNPFLPKKDIKKIRAIIEKVSEKHYQDTSELVLENYNIYREECVYIQREFTSKESLLRFICQDLEKKGYLTSNYLKTVLEREKIASTSYNNIAIPHGFPEEVLKPCIAICTLKTRLPWGEHMVNMVALICVNNEVQGELNHIFTNLYHFFEDKKQQKKILNARDAQEILHLLSENKE